jgi:hypothetical protein
MNVFIDIETIPAGDPIDPRSLTPPSVMSKADTIEKWFVEKAPEIAIEKFKARALDSMQGEILCIGYAIDNDDPEVITGNEKWQLEILHSLISVAQDSHTFIGWNIKSFDIPWLWRKAIQHNLPNVRNLFNRDRYRGNAIDLMEVWASDFKNYNKMQDVAKYLGLPGKTDGIDGSMIYGLYLDGKMNEIIEYCKNDVSTAREIWRRIYE